ncbi:MAG: HAD-IA family hydrolase [Sphingomonas sp.]|uniref:HAD-IA family hydrolase n=1 Tax=Sphingomonas sp. TaxID=28214 RepID=UPI003F7EFA42
MSDFPFALVGFDLDGTLVDSVADLAAAVNHALATIDRAPLTVEQVRPMIGGGTRLMLQRALDATGGDAALDGLLPVLLDHYAAHIADRTRPFPGVIEALDALRARGVTLAVVTNKIEHLSRKLLGELGLLDRFVGVIGGDTAGLTATKPDRAPIDLMQARYGHGGRAAFVGDTDYDIRAARAAGMPVALFSPNKSSNLGADVIFSHYDQLADALAQAAAVGQPIT